MNSFIRLANCIALVTCLSVSGTYSACAGQQPVKRKPSAAVSTKAVVSPAVHTGKQSHQLAMFGMGKKAKTNPEEPAAAQDTTQAAPSAPDAAKENESAAAAKQKEPAAATPQKPSSQSVEQPAKEANGAPVLVPDAALISVLKDLWRELKDSPDIEKLEDPCQKTAAKLAVQALGKALANPQLPSNRILPAAERKVVESSMRAEAWDSGDIDVSGNCHASLSALWAKKIDGLVNLAIAGNCNCKPAPGGKLGEFVFVLTGKSTVDKGFDIQSQSDVNFWLGKINGFSVDTSCCADQPVAVDKDRAMASTLVLKAVLTERTRKYLTDLASYQEHQRFLAQKEQDKKIAEEKASEQAKAKEKAELEASLKAELEAKAQLEKAVAAAKSSDTAPKPDIEKREPTATKPAAAAEVNEKAAQSEDQRNLAYFDSASGAAPQMAMSSPLEQLPQTGNQKGWDSPQPAPASRIPSSAARILVPDKAIAGQFLTAAVLNPNHAGEALVGLTFNGGPLATGQDGRALYMVPEDSVPGPSLQVSLAARPEAGGNTITVIQPLSAPGNQQIPRVDMVSPVVQAGGMITIDGHYFDGVADRNRVIIDGMYDARVLVSSPVQLKADLPSNLIPGEHSISVSTNDLRSNPGQFEIISVDIQPDAKEVARDALSKLILRVSGTKNQVRVHLKNYTPQVIRLTKGNEQYVVTPGGPNNALVVGVQRVGPGNYHVQATID